MAVVAALVPLLASPGSAGQVNPCTARSSSNTGPNGGSGSSTYDASTEVGQDDGRAWGRSTTKFPPPFKMAVDSANQFMAARSWYTNSHPPYFHISTAAMEFLVDGLPQGAQIQSAGLCLFVKSIQNHDERNLTADWYEVNTSTNGTNWTIDQSFYSKTAKTTALAGSSLSAFTPGQFNFVPLDNGTGVQTSVDNGYSYVGIRLHVSGGKPAGKNYVYITSSEGGQAPFMIITYTTP